MIIKDVQLETSRRGTMLSAMCKVRKIGWDRLYFSVEGSGKQHYVYTDASPFAAALLIPSMRQGEDLVIHGPISSRLYDGMHEVMETVLSWNIGLKHINIVADKLVVDRQKPTHTASFFSGGVDSFYTYLKHRQDRSVSHRVDSFILVNGFDIKFSEQQLWDQTSNNIKAIAKAEGIEIVTVRSNINTVLEPLLRAAGEWHEPWDYVHGGCLAAVGLMLRNRFQRIYIPSTHSVAEQIPWGSNLAVDKNWSTERLEFIHDGTEATRLQKVETQIAKSPVALRYLRVCYMNKSGKYNCGKCDKCLRTMVNLYIAGGLTKAKTFPREIDTDLIANTLTIRGEHGGIFHNENLAALRQKNLNPELQRAIETSLTKTAALDKEVMSDLKDRVVWRLFYKTMYTDFAYGGGHVYGVLYRLFGTRLF